MTVYGVQHFLQAAAQQRQILEGELARLDQEAARHQQNRQVVASSLDAARADLAKSLLPGLVPELVSRAIQLTGFSPWRHEDPIRRLEGERLALASELSSIEGDPLFAQGELLFHPRTGSVTRELAEVSSHLASQQEILASIEGHPRFPHLFEVGYGTSAYAVPFWRLTYYDDWKAGDEILERFPGKTFEEVRGLWQEARRAATTLGEEVARLDGQIRRGRALWDRHAQLTERLRTLPGEHLVAAQRRLLDHVLTSHGPTILAALGRDPTLPNLYLRATALAAKVHYLDGVFMEYVQRPREALRAQRDKLARDQVKYQRPKNAWATFPDVAFQKRFADRRAAWDKRHKRYQSTYVAIWGFDDWDRVPTDRDFLWWDVMTDGEIDGDYLSDVDEWHRRHGRPTYLRDRRRDAEDRDDAHAAAAAAAAAREEQDLYRAHDPS